MMVEERRRMGNANMRKRERERETWTRHKERVQHWARIRGRARETINEWTTLTRYLMRVDAEGSVWPRGGDEARFYGQQMRDAWYVVCGARCNARGGMRVWV